MSRFIIASALYATILAAVPALAAPGPAPTGTAMADYDPVTGQIVVSVSGVNNWFVMDQYENVLTGDEPLGLPAAGYLVSNNDNVIGETSSNLSDAGLFGYTDLNLGNVAQTGLVNDGSLNIYWNAGLGQPLLSQPINFDYFNTPPTPSSTTFAEYDVSTGQIIVTVDGVNNWYLSSESSSLTGDAPSGFLGAGGLVTDNDTNIGETAFELFSVTELNLGNVAQPGLALGDLSLFWNEGLGTPLQMRPVDYVGEIPLVTADDLASPDDARVDTSNRALFSFSELYLENLAPSTVPINGIQLVTFNPELVQQGGSGQLTFVPEPTTLALLVLGLLGMDYRRRKQV